MTNTKFRKRALLSSVAMLLVALVALGSATFAWFVANPEVKADGLTATTKADSGIRIASDTDLGTTAAGAQLALYDEEAAFISTAVTLTPASPQVSTLNTMTIGNTTWKSTTATSAANGAMATGATITDATPYTYNSASNAAVYYEDIWMYSDDNSVVKAYSVKFNKSSAAIAKGLKVAIVSHQGDDTTPTDTLIGVWAADSEATKTYASDAFNTTTTYLADEATARVNGSTNASFANAVPAIVKGNDSSGSASRIRVYVYLDGEHSDVKSNNALSLTDLVEAGKSITVKMSTKDADISWS